jgi:hypothetical protein
MEFWQALLILCPAAALGGAINAIAGGGTLVTFPALMFVLNALSGSSAGSAIIANATSTVALCPGSFTSAWGYRRELKQLWIWVKSLAPPSLLGGIAGSATVALAPESTFEMMVPWLIGLATVLFIAQPRLARSTVSGASDRHSSAKLPLVAGLQFFIGLYGGYFGAGIGILMLSSLSLIVPGNIHQVNGLKTILAGLINVASVVVFSTAQEVNWKLALPMMLAASLGGWLGASWARKLDKTLVRRMVIGIGVVLTVWYFGQQFAAPGAKTPPAPDAQSG